MKRAPVTPWEQSYLRLHEAAMAGNEPRMRELVASGMAVDIADADGRTALHRAAHVGNVEGVRVLLDLGAAVDARATYDGDHTPLLAACGRNGGECHPGVVKRLLEAGADPSAIDRVARSPLHLVAASSTAPDSLLRLLLEAGANPFAKDFNDERASHPAIDAWLATRAAEHLADSLPAGIPTPPRERF